MAENEKILSERQYEVLHLVAHGLTLLEIAARLGIQSVTVKSHLDTVYERLGVHSQAEAVHTAHKLGILT